MKKNQTTKWNLETEKFNSHLWDKIDKATKSTARSIALFLLGIAVGYAWAWNALN